jgi:hypothetical protein
MPTELISIGPPTAMLQNVTYALPARLVHITSSVAIDVSSNGTAWSALTGANTTGVLTSGSFIRCTTGSASVTCKAE